MNIWMMRHLKLLKPFRKQYGPNSVSGFPNRLQFIEDYGFGKSEGALTENHVIVLLTLASPDHINGMIRAFGHNFTDEIIRLGAHRLREVLPPEARLYHVGFQCFAFVMEFERSQSDPQLLKSIEDVFSRPLMCNGIPIRNQIGIGLNTTFGSVFDASEILRGAFVAAKESRSTSKSWAWYDRGSDKAHLRSFRLLADLGRMMDASDEVAAAQLSLHYQPKINLRTGECCGVEGLVRWIHPNLGFISPNEFISLAEATAVITPLTRWVFRQGVRQRAAWHRDNIHARISLNVSPVNLAEPDFADFVLETCRNEGVAPNMMEIEFTESARTLDSKQTLAQLSRLRTEGIRISIDDFGSGYSNMKYLRSIPADTLKIDKEFILTLDTDAKNRKIVPSIIDLGKKLGFTVVAEGIESAAAYNTLAAWGCDEGQGFFMSRPLAEPDFRKWYTENTLAETG